MAGYAWEPSPEYVEQANVTRLMRAHGIDDYRTLVERSQREPEWFWDAAVGDLGISFAEPYDKVLDESRGPQWPRWFTGGKLNLAYNCVFKHEPGAAALLWEGEDGATRTLTYGDLAGEVARVARGLVAMGIGEGDTVGVYMPMVPEAIVAAYACAAIGAIYLPIFSGFGAPAVAARLNDAEVKLVFTANGFYRRGSVVAMKETLDEALASCPTVGHVAVCERIEGMEWPRTSRDATWDEAFPAASADEDFRPVPLDAESPLLIAYTSGTTGRPKGAVHVHGGFLVKIAAECAYQTDVKPGDVLYWVTDMGWIMGPWEMVGSHASGATVFMYEGAPNYPSPSRLWEMCERHGVTILGISPTLVRALMPAGEEPVAASDLSRLRILASTGEPWNPEPYRWFARVVGGDRCPIINISGGTEVGACFLGQAPVIPTKACSLGTPALGMSIDVYDPDGKPVRGRVGELVCTQPWPGQTRGFWGDPQRYLDTYWSRWPGVWVHGDWASIDDDGYWFLHGRSDDTLNIAGKRIGPAEFESAAVDHPAVTECAAVGIPDDVKGETVWCFCIPRPGTDTGGDAGNALQAEVKAVIAGRLGKAFTPARILFVDELPKTRSAKILRRAIRATALGTDPGDLSSLENPSAIDAVARAAGTPG